MSAGADVPDLQMPPGALELAREMEHQKLDLLAQRVQNLKRENDMLRERVDRSEKEQHDFVGYFQRELEMKDSVLADLKDEFAKKEGDFRTEVRAKCAAYETQIAALKKESLELETQLRARIKVLEDDQKMMSGFRENKEQIESRISELSEALKGSEERRERDTADLERKFLMDKAQLEREMEKEKQRMIEQARTDAEIGLSTKTKAIWADNQRIGEELKFQSQMLTEIQEEKAKVEEESAAIKRDLELLREKEKEYLKQIRQKTLSLHALNKKVDELDTARAQAEKQFAEDKAKLRSKAKKATEGANVDLDGMKTLIKAKNKELRHVKKLAQAIVDERTEVGQFFLEALGEVRAKIRAEREENYRLELDMYNEKMREAARSGKPEDFPKIRAHVSKKGLTEFMTRKQQTRLPVSMYDKVDFKRLTWEDKEKVLRMLFAKINSMQQGVHSQPGHSLDSQKSEHEWGFPPSQSVSVAQG